MAAMLGCDQMFVGPCGVGIAHHNVGGHEATVLQLHAHGFVVLNADRRDGRVVMNGNTAAFQQTHQALHDGAGAAHGRMHTPGALQRIDQGIGAGDRKRIAANQQGVKAQHDAQFVVADVFGHQAVNAAPCAHAGKRGNGIDQVANRVEGNRPQTFKAQGFAQLGIGQKVFITDQIVG